MSTRKGRGVTVVPVAPVGNKKTSTLDYDNQSAIGCASFIEGLQQKSGNPLHSTAIEEDLSSPKVSQMAKSQMGKNITQKVKKIGKTRPRKNELAKVEKKSGPANRRSSDSQEESDPGTGSKKRQNEVLSFDDDTDEDTCWNPSPKKAKLKSVERPPKKLSADKTRRVEKKRTKRSGGETELEVVMEAFLGFCDEYKDSVESNAIKQSIDCFSNNVKEQLLEKFASYKEFKVLKRENAKVCSMIRAKTQKLFDAKHELIRAERQVSLLQKEKADLKLRLEDLRRSQAFLKDIKQLNKVYLDYRTAHPKEKEMYGASSLPALLLQTKNIQGAQDQLRQINKKLENKVKGNGI
ncbi:centromere protein U isoform X2 [Hippocampus zosterae]|uniref:centromere protein U isoform X2 n=1 Tax=Hippocampus zosterae TaxID=109293 RepID=UPI00223D7EAA|nr:centromere protein U isoform X2 [Hippocampus zosterae]